MKIKEIKANRMYRLENDSQMLLSTESIILLLKLNDYSSLIENVLCHKKVNINNSLPKCAQVICVLKPYNVTALDYVLCYNLDHSYFIMDADYIIEEVCIKKASNKKSFTVGEAVFYGGSIDFVTDWMADGLQLYYNGKVSIEDVAVLPDIRNRKYTEGEHVQLIPLGLLQNIFVKDYYGDYKTKFRFTKVMEIGYNNLRTGIVSQVYDNCSVQMLGYPFAFGSDVLLPQITNHHREEAEITIKDKKVTVVLPDGRVGKAKCSDNDSYDIETGIELALTRAVFSEIK